MNLQNFVKKLKVFNVLFGAKAKKLSGINDSENKLTGNIEFIAPNEIVLPVVVPEYITEQTYFRVKAGGGANEDELFRVASVSGSTIVVDNSNTVVNFVGSARIDARLAVVHDNPLISRLNSEGATIFNLSNYTDTGLEDCSGIAGVFAEHYHDDGSAGTGSFVFTFDIIDWFSTDAGDTYSIDVSHGLNTLFPKITVFDTNNEELLLHKIRILDGNTVRIKVTQQGADGRFEGKGIVGYVSS